MGVPAFYRWLSTRYPRAIKTVTETVPAPMPGGPAGTKIPVDSTQPNPNGVEFDNLYLDMNGIIHPCFHPEDKEQPTSEEEVFRNIFDYIDRLFCVIRPRKVLYMAIDGVAPRAKMNQQRSRRFKSAQEAAEKEQEEDKLRAEFALQGIIVPKKERTSIFDSNIITPGTGFMHRLSSALQYYIHMRMNTEPAWRDIKVILSDANVPGEGEHKVMNFIRLQRGQPGWDPNTKHVLYGLDADLIMLGLATHEAHFYILREEVFDKNRNNNSNNRGPPGAIPGGGELHKFDVYQKPFQFVEIAALRECLDIEMRNKSDPDKDLERVIDDFVLMCYFVGNDFLPHIPTLDIREGAIDLLMHNYRVKFKEIGGYLANGSELNWGNVERFLKLVSQNEDQIFGKRAREDKRQKERARKRAFHNRRHQQNQQQQNPLFGMSQMGAGNGNHGAGNSNHSAAAMLKARLTGSKRPASEAMGGEDNGTKSKNPAEYWEQLSSNKGAPASSDQIEAFKAKVTETMKQHNDLSEDPRYADNILLGESGWKNRYYEKKFGTETDEEREKLVSDVVQHYIEGLQWVMRYYYDGCTSWEWYYPYHYAPFASDFYGLEDKEVKFNLGTPFKPFNQLMGVLPAASRHCLPEKYGELMVDEKSPILDFYPQNFELDLNGKRFAWQAIVLLPFIDQKRLLDAIAPCESSISREEKIRNSTLSTTMFVHSAHPFGRQCLELKDVFTKVNPVLSDALNGNIKKPNGEPCPKTLPSPIEGEDDIDNNNVVCCIFEDPAYHKHQSRLLPGARPEKKDISNRDVHVPGELWHEQNEGRGPYPNNRGGQGFVSAGLAQNHNRLMNRGAVNPYQANMYMQQQQRGHPSYGGVPQSRGYGGVVPGQPYMNQQQHPYQAQPYQQPQHYYSQPPLLPQGYPYHQQNPPNGYMPPPPPVPHAIPPHPMQPGHPPPQQQQRGASGYNPFSALVREKEPPRR